MALKITHERADMRRHLWVQAPMRVLIDGVAYRAAEWSLGGVAIAPAAPELSRIGKTVAARIELPFQGFDISFDAGGEIEAWSMPTQRAEIGFRGLGERERELLSHFIDELVRGNMTSVGATIQRLDAPFAALAAAPAADGPTAHATRKSWHRWRPLRAATMTSLYAAGGVAALGYLATLLYSNMYWLEAQTSVLSAPVERLVSLGDGAVTWAAFKPGDLVKSGDTIVSVADNMLEREIGQAEIGIREKENKLAFLARRFENEKKKLSAFAGLSNLKSAKGNAEIEGLNAKLQSAQRELRQLPATAAGALAQVRQRIVGLKQAISLREFERNGLSNLAKENGGSMEYVGPTYVGEIDNIAAQIELAETDIEIAKQRHHSFVNQRERLIVRAPFDGVLRALPHSNKTSVKKGDVAAVVEGTTEHRVTAYVRQDQVLRVQLGAAAIVQVPATRQTFRATVAEIDPARGNDGEHGHAGTHLTGTRQNEGAMVAVHLALDNSALGDDPGNYRDGLPAITMIGLSKPIARKPALAGQAALSSLPDAAAGRSR